MNVEKMLEAKVRNWFDLCVPEGQHPVTVAGEVARAEDGVGCQ